MQSNIFKKGFTIIELLVVMSIISFIASIILSSVQESRSKAELAVTFDQFRQVRDAIFEYESQNSILPMSVEGNLGYDEMMANLLSSGSIRQVPEEASVNNILDMRSDDPRVIINGVGVSGPLYRCEGDSGLGDYEVYFRRETGVADLDGKFPRLLLNADDSHFSSDGNYFYCLFTPVR